MIEWIPEYNGGHVQTFNIQYRIVNETKTWLPQKIPQYNRQTYTLSGLQSNTWYELRMFAKISFTGALLQTYKENQQCHLLVCLLEYLYFVLLKI